MIETKESIELCVTSALSSVSLALEPVVDKNPILQNTEYQGYHCLPSQDFPECRNGK